MSRTVILCRGGHESNMRGILQTDGNIYIYMDRAMAWVAGRHRLGGENGNNHNMKYIPAYLFFVIRLGLITSNRVSGYIERMKGFGLRISSQSSLHDKGVRRAPFQIYIRCKNPVHVKGRPVGATNP